MRPIIVDIHLQESPLQGIRLTLSNNGKSDAGEDRGMRTRLSCLVTQCLYLESVNGEHPTTLMLIRSQRTLPINIAWGKPDPRQRTLRVLLTRMR